jgi:anti-sigma factor RsiW
MNMFTPEPNKQWPPAPCATYEDRILDLEHGQLTEPVRRTLEAHLAECPACRQFAEELKALDAALASKFQPKTLPGSFRASVLARVDAAAASATPEIIARRKAAIASEFDRQSTGLLRRVVRENWSKVLDGFGLVALALVAALFAQRLLSGDIRVSSLMPSTLHDYAGTYLLWGTAAASVTSAWWLGLREKLRHAML